MEQAVRNLYASLAGRNSNCFRRPQRRNIQVEVMDFKGTLFAVEAVIGIDHSIVGSVGPAVRPDNRNPDRRRWDDGLPTLQSNAGHGRKEFALLLRDMAQYYTHNIPNNQTKLTTTNRDEAAAFSITRN